MNLMDELVSAGYDSNELLGNPMKHRDFVAKNNLDDSSLSHSGCEDFTVDLTDMKNIYPGSKYNNIYGNVDTTNKNNSTLFENCAINLDQELEEAVTLTGSPMTTISDQEKFQESNLQSNSLNVSQEQVQAMSQLPEENINQVEVQEVTRMPRKVLSLEEELSQVFSSKSKTCDIVEMDETNSDNYGSYNKDHDDSNFEDYDGSIKNCDNDDTGDYDGSIKNCDNDDTGNYDGSIKNCDNDDTGNYDGSIKNCDNGDTGNYDGSIKICDNGDTGNYDGSIKNCDNDDTGNYDGSIKNCDNDDTGNYDGSIKICDTGNYDGSIKNCDNGDTGNYDGSIKICDNGDTGNYDGSIKNCDNGDTGNYDGSIKICDNGDTGNYESRIKFHDNDADNYDSGIKGYGDYDVSIKDHDTDDIVNYVRNIKGHDNDDIGYYDNSNKNHANDDINYDSDIKSHNNTIDNYATNNDDHEDNDIDSYATNNNDDHGHNEIDNNHNNGHDDNSLQLLCENLVGESDIAAETKKDVISSVVNNFSPKRDMEKEHTLIKDETNVGNNLESDPIDMVMTEPSTEISVCVDMIKTESPTEVAIDVDEIRIESPTKIAIDVDMIRTDSTTEIAIDVDMIRTDSTTEIAIDVDMIRTDSPTEIAIDVDMIKTEFPVKDSNSTNISSNFAAKGTLNDSIKTEPSYKAAICCNSEDRVTMLSLNCETDHGNESVVEQLALDSHLEKDCETFEDLFLQEKARFMKREKEVESLTKQLHDKHKVLQQAVNFGKQLLEENGELKEKVDKLEHKMIVIVEEMKNEKHSLKLKLESKEYMEQQYSEEISLLQNEITQIKNDVQSYQKQEAHLNRELKNKDYLLEQSNLKEEELNTTIKNLEKLLLQKTEEAVHYPSQSFSDDNQQQMALEKEVLDLQTECTTLKSQLISSYANANRVEEELLRAKRRLDEKQQEYEEIRSEINSFEKTHTISQRDILDLKAQLYAAQVENMNRQDRGNSLFSEVEDRRISAEKMVMALQENYQALKEKYNLEKQQNYKLKMQTMSLYQMNSSKGNETELEFLNCKLIQSQHDIRQLQEKIKNMEKHELQQNDKLMNIQKAFGTKENQGLIDFLNSLNEKKQKELQIIQEKLSNLEMQYIQETDKVVNYMKKLRLAEEKAESLGYSNMKLKLQVEELLIKYKPDEIGDVKNDRKIKIEKIPLVSSENIPKLKTQKEHCKPEQKVLDEKKSKTNRRKLELARCGYINPVDFLDGSPKAKKIVSMSNNVEIIDHEGNKEQKPVSTPSAISKQTKKSKGKLVPRHKIIEVKAPSDDNAMECTQQ